MTVITGLALRMRLELAELTRKHGLSAVAARHLPLAPVSDRPQVLEGLASTVDVDADRMRFRAYAFPLSVVSRPPLLFRHDPTQPAGSVDDLHYDDHGQLVVRTTVVHPIARRCNAFSVCATIRAYELRDVDGPSFHALVTSAEVVEISMTDRPANPQALVARRYPTSAAAEFYSLIAQRVACLQQLVPLLTPKECPT